MTFKHCIALLSLSVVAIPTVSLADIGAPAGPDPFILTFDEDGHATVEHFNPLTGGYDAAVSSPGFLAPSATASGLALTYRLPEFVGPGDVSIFEPGTTNAEDGIRFFNDGISGLMQYFSDSSSALGGNMADTGLPRDFVFGFGISEVGPEGKNGFNYVAGGGDPAGTNFYVGTSDSGRDAVPEPGTIALVLGAGIAGMSLISRKRRK